jgi:peptidoglycan biosynthesis protein MviN/MurJ (putative lipid II flippase)
MLENILFIASIISALTAVTTSLRALGKKRESSGGGKNGLRRVLHVYLFVAIIWSFLSMIFAAPILYKKWVNEQIAGLFLPVLLFFVLFIFLVVFWKKVLNSGEVR